MFWLPVLRSKSGLSGGGSLEAAIFWAMTVLHEDKRRKRVRKSCEGFEKDIALDVKWSGSRFSGRGDGEEGLKERRLRADRGVTVYCTEGTKDR